MSSKYFLGCIRWYDQRPGYPWLWSLRDPTRVSAITIPYTHCLTQL